MYNVLLGNLDPVADEGALWIFASTHKPLFFFSSSAGDIDAIPFTRWNH
jgi:hypothetical protein